MRPCINVRSLSLGHEDNIRGDVAAIAHRFRSGDALNLKILSAENRVRGAAGLPAIGCRHTFVPPSRAAR
jgi:hypothetical protein